MNQEILFFFKHMIQWLFSIKHQAQVSSSAARAERLSIILTISACGAGPSIILPRPYRGPARP